MLLPLLLLGCDPWNIPDGGSNWPGELWDPAVVAAKDGVYVRLPSAGQLVRVTNDGAWSTVDLDGARPDRLFASPDGASVFVDASWDVCEDDDPAIVYPEDCPGSKLSTATEVALVRDGERVGDAALDGVSAALDQVAWTTDSGTAALYLSPEAGAEVIVDGYLNLNEVTFVETANASVHRVSVGFAPESVLFTGDDSRAVVLSRSQVAVVNLANDTDGCDAWSVCVTYHLTLDADQTVTPRDVVLVDGGRYALVSVESSSDVYVLDLERESVDLLELVAPPTAVVDDPANERTIFTFGTRAMVSVLEHEFFEVQDITTDEPASAAELTTSGVLLYNDAIDAYKDVLMFDPASGDWDEQRAENPIYDLRAGTRFAVASERPEGTAVGDVYDSHYVFGIFQLAPAGTDVRDPVHLVLESEPVGLETLETDSADYALLLLRDLDTLLKVRLDDASATAIDLPAAPLGISASPDASFIVTGDSPMGMVSFVDPADDSIETVTGFATSSFLGRQALPRRAASE